MRWLARRPSATAGLPQAESAEVALGADDTMPDADALLSAAERFLMLFHDENSGAGAFTDRMGQVCYEVKAQGPCGLRRGRV
jgi:hypothetical protein